MNIVLTNAGLQKIVNAEQTGTAPVIISQIAFGSGQYTANASQIALQNEIKRLPVISSGTTTHRWKSVYAVNGTIQTSDENLKEEIGEIPEAVFKAWANVKFVQYKFKDAVKEKGEKARIHIGLIDQRIIAAFAAEGLDACDYGLVCRDALKDGGEILSLRYDECLALECAYERNRFEKILIKLKGGDN